MVVTTTTAGKAPRTIPAALPGHPCFVRGKRHQRWQALARCVWPSATWISGSLPTTRPCLALTSCRPHMAVSLHGTLAAALDARRHINECGCGSGCRDRHEVVALGPADGGPTP
jgi:hypothetical protein